MATNIMPTKTGIGCGGPRREGVTGRLLGHRFDADQIAPDDEQQADQPDHGDGRQRRAGAEDLGR
jgi:hypothetical protein